MKFERFLRLMGKIRQREINIIWPIFEADEDRRMKYAKGIVYFNNDGDEKPLTADQKAIVQRIYDHYDGRLSHEVVLFKTIHGHIVDLRALPGIVPEFHSGRPGRIGIDDIRMFNQDGLRWIDFACDYVRVGL